MTHVAKHGLLGILLHTGIYRGVYPQTILIDVVVRPVALLVFLTPTIERVGLPLYGVDDELSVVPLRIVVPQGFVCHKRLPQIFSQIGRHTLLVVHTVEIQHYRLCSIHIILRLRDISLLLHLLEHHVSPLSGSLLIAHRVIQRWVLA